MLTAPQSGERTRKLIRKNLDDTGKKIAVAFEDAGERVIETVDELQGKMIGMVDEVSKDANRRTRHLQKISKRIVSEQKASLGRGMKRARNVLS